jgi:uncharacterized phiE125 gp8 family phage protein
MPYKVITQPTVEPVTLADVKLHCRVDHTDEDTYISGLLKAAREYCENFTGRAFVERTLQYNLNKWPSRKVIYLPRPPLVSVTSVIYHTTTGTPITLTAGTDYLVDADSEPGAILLPDGKTWPTASLYPLNPIRITYIAGYEAETGPPVNYRVNIPEYVNHAIKLYVGSLYENREAVLPAGHIGRTLPMGMESLLWQERVFWSEELNR